MAVSEENTRRQPVRGARPPGLKLGNRMVIGLQRIGLAFGPMHLLTVPGRKTGKLRTTPVSVVTVGGARYLVQAFPRAAWVANASAAGEGVLARGRTRTRVRLSVLPVGERTAILRELPVVAAGATGIFVRSGMVASADPDGFAAAAARIAVFRIEDALQRETGIDRTNESAEPSHAWHVTAAAATATGQRGALPPAIQLWLAVLTLAAVVTEFALAGLGAFRGSDAASAQDSFYDPHRVLGFGIAGLVVLLLAAVIAGRARRRAVIVAVLLVILAAAGQPLLAQAGGTHAWVGSLHAVNGLLILGLTATLARDARANRVSGR